MPFAIKYGAVEILYLSVLCNFKDCQMEPLLAPSYKARATTEPLPLVFYKLAIVNIDNGQLLKCPIKMRAASLLSPSLITRGRMGEKAALNLMKHSHFVRTPQ